MLGYRVNSAAHSLRSRRANALAITVAVDDNRPYFTELLLGATTEAFSCGQALLLFPGHKSIAANAAGELLDTRRADGLILNGITAFDEEILAKLADRLVVVQDRVFPLPPHLKGVLLDNDAGRASAMAHVTFLGHTAVAYLGPSRHTGVRLKSYRLGMAAAGIEPRPELVAYTDPSIDAAARAAEHLLAAGPRPTAIVCANDVLAAGVYQAAARFALHIPGDLTVASFANFAVATALQPQLTAVINPVQTAGAAAVRLLLALLHGERRESIVLASPLAVRGSTAPPR
jgi:DNA-binding LacI/PurR family transcriptional regulator